jgi:hypothetical protein
MATLSGEEKLLTEILGNFVANHLKGKHSSHLSYLKIAYRFVEKYIIYCYQKTVSKNTNLTKPTLVLLFSDF